MNLNYPITVLQAALLALNRVNIQDSRIQELKTALKLLEDQNEPVPLVRTMGQQNPRNP